MNIDKTNKFINKAKKIHNDKYDYSLVDYIHSKTKVKIICFEHGVFEQMPQKHLIGQGCSKCSKTKKLTTEKFIKKSQEIHGNKYDYSIVNYINYHTKVKIICPEHGVFEQKPDNHLNGNGCFKCCGNDTKTTEQFINESQEIHGNKYNYSLVKYINNKTKVKIICKKHGIFEQTPNKHLKKQHCPICIGNIKKTNDQFILDSKKIHGDRYDYILVNYINTKTKVKIICPIHGVFEQIPTNHIDKQYGCPVCKESKGERMIRNILLKNNIKNNTQKRFKKCKNKLSLPFDFYLPDYNTCIEYDGKQHFEPVKRFGGSEQYQKTLINDNIKNIFCDKNNINLLRITYKDNINQK